MSERAEEDLILKAGWGLCHYFIITLCAMCTMAEATASLIVLVTMTLLACDLNYITKSVLTLNAFLSLGMAVGNLVFGIFSDYNGRQTLIPISMTMIFSASVGLAFSRTYLLISLSIFIFGIGAAGSKLTLRVYLIECLPATKRGRYLASIDIIWIIGYIIGIGVSWSLIPSIIRLFKNEFRPISWRVLIAVAGTPNLIMACGASLLPSNPRFLIHRRRLPQALNILQQMFAINNSQHVANFPPINLNNYSRIGDEEIATENIIEMIEDFFSKTWQRLIIIFSPKIIGRSFLLILIRLLLFPGYIWLALWSTHVFTYQLSLDVNLISKNQTCTIDATDIAKIFLNDCQHVNDTYFKYLFVFSNSFIIGELLLALGIDVLGRRLSLVTSGLVGAISIVTLAFAEDYNAKFILIVFFLASYSMIETTITIIQLENYPTTVRGTVVGLTSMLPHLVLFFTKLLVQISCTKSLYIMSGIAAGAVVLALPLTDFFNIPMQE